MLPVLSSIGCLEADQRLVKPPTKAANLGLGPIALFTRAHRPDAHGGITVNYCLQCVWYRKLYIVKHHLTVRCLQVKRVVDDQPRTKSVRQEITITTLLKISQSVIHKS